MKMKNKALQTAGMLFLLVAIIHGVRFVMKIPVVVGDMAVPVWTSVPVALILFCLAIWMFKASK